MHRIIATGTMIGVAAAVSGCAQVTVTSETLLNSTARIADASTDALRSTSQATTNASNNIFAQTHEARRQFVGSRYAMIKREAAYGSGQDLDALAYMMQSGDRQDFESKLQANYGQLFSGRPNADTFLSRLYRVVGIPPDMRDAAGSRAG